MGTENTASAGSRNGSNPCSIAIVWREILRGVFPIIGRLALLTACPVEDLTEWLAPEAARHALSVVHELVWRDWLQSTLEAQQSDLQSYWRHLPCPFEETLRVWRDSRPYLTFVPVSAETQEREYFLGQMELLISILDSQHIPQPANSGRLADQVLRLIQERYADPHLSLRSVSRDLHVSEGHLGKLFRIETGFTFRRYLRQVRIQRAISLLECSGHGIKTICSLVGYQDLSHFTQYFRNATGTTPAEFRNKQRSQSAKA